MLARMLLQFFHAFRPKRLVLTFHGSEILRFAGSPWRRGLSRQLIRHATRVSTLSNYTQELLLNHFPEAADKIYLTFIADGTHVPLFVLKNYLSMADPERCIVVTDAIAPAGLGPGRYKFARWDLLIEDDLVARAPDRSHFVGSAITMRQSEANLKKIGLSDKACAKLTRNNPRAVIEPGS